MVAIGVGLIGSGYMGKCHALAWNSVRPVFGDVPRPRLVSLCEVNDDLARTRAEEFGFETSTSDWRTLVDDPSVDVVSITTPNHLHAELAIGALRAGKHVWCEKPMAPRLADAEAMCAAARESGKVTLLGYNYIQNPAIRHIKGLLANNAIGDVNYVRIEMDEDFMANAGAPFSWRSAAAAGYGALDDFGVHPLSIIWTLFGEVTRVFGEMVKPYADRPTSAGGRRAVENFDIATALVRLNNGVSGTIQMNRAAWGRKGRIFMQIFGARGTIVYDQERMNEVMLFSADGAPENQGFRSILMGPVHKPYDRFMPAPGHQLGFNELKTIECRQLIGLINGEKAHAIGFTEGIHIERTIHAIAAASTEGCWRDVG